MNKETTFKERCKLGNNQEHYVNDIFNLCGIPSKINNSKIVTDMDLFLTMDKIYIDVKYLERSFNDSEFYANIKPENCLIIDKGHVKKYEEKRLKTGLDTWVVFFINFKDLNIFELRFIKTEYIFDLIENEKAIVRPIKENGRRKLKINLDKNNCLTMFEFINFLQKKRQSIEKIITSD